MFCVSQTVAKSLAGKKLVQFNASDTAFGPRGLVACKPALLPCLDTLERAYFCNNGLSEHAGKSRDELIAHATSHCADRQRLHSRTCAKGRSRSSADALTRSEYVLPR